MTSSPTPNLDAYFRRIGYDGARAPTRETLTRIHALHVAAVPFENLAAFLGEGVRIDLDSLEEKLVRSGRGGWCFEHNLLFWHVLTALGFPVKRLGARVRWNVAPGVVTARSHMLMRVEVPEGTHIADVGFGGLTLTSPLRLEADVEQATPHEPHRLRLADGIYTLEARLAGEWQALYTFDLAEQQEADYEVSNWYLANHPQSQFVTGVIAARADPGRRHALRNTRYSIYHPNGETERRMIASVAEFREVLSGTMQIRLPDNPLLDQKLAALLA